MKKTNLDPTTVPVRWLMMMIQYRDQHRAYALADVFDCGNKINSWTFSKVKVPSKIRHFVMASGRYRKGYGKYKTCGRNSSIIKSRKFSVKNLKIQPGGWAIHMQSRIEKECGAYCPRINGNYAGKRERDKSALSNWPKTMKNEADRKSETPGVLNILTCRILRNNFPTAKGLVRFL